MFDKVLSALAQHQPPCPSLTVVFVSCLFPGKLRAPKESNLGNLHAEPRVLTPLTFAVMPLALNAKNPAQRPQQCRREHQTAMASNYQNFKPKCLKARARQKAKGNIKLQELQPNCWPNGLEMPKFQAQKPQQKGAPN